MLLYESYSEFMKSQSKGYFTNDILNEAAFARLNSNDKKNNLVEAVLNEAFTSRSVIDDFLKDKLVGVGKDLSKAHTDLTISVRKSSGDISKVKHYKDIDGLLKYALTQNRSVNIPGEKEGIDTFDSYANSILNLMNSIKQYSGSFKTAIQRESKLPESRRLCTALYFGLVTTTILLATECYSSGINATFTSTNPPMVDNLYYKLSASDIAIYSNIVDQLNVIIRKVPDFMTRGLSEAIDDGVERITELNENVLDVVFGLISRSTVLTDIILIPVYLVRFLIYIFKYGVSYVSKLSDSIKEAIAIQKKSNLTANEFNAYKNTNSSRSIALNQAVQRADSALDIESAKDKNNLRNVNSTVIL